MWVGRDQSGMSDQRALMTDRQREVLRGEADVTYNYRKKVESEVRSRIRERLAEDVEVLAESQPDLYEELQAVVCDEV